VIAEGDPLNEEAVSRLPSREFNEVIGEPIVRKPRQWRTASRDNKTAVAWLGNKEFRFSCMLILGTNGPSAVMARLP